MTMNSIHDTRTAAEIAYDATRMSRPVYVDVSQPSQLDQALDAAERPSWAERNPLEPFGELRGGTPIEGHTDENDPSGRCGVVSVELGGFRLTAQDEPNTIDIESDVVRIEGATIAEITELRALLTTDAPEQLLAAAVAYGRGDSAPPPPPPASIEEGIREHLQREAARSAIQTYKHGTTGRWVAPAPVASPVEVKYIHCDNSEDEGDLNTEGRGHPVYIDYECGAGQERVRITFRIDGVEGPPNTSFFERDDVELATAEAAVANYRRLLADPRVKAALAPA